MGSVQWGEVFDKILPILTLLMGAWIARGSSRREERLRAAVELADLHKRVWKKFDDDDWVDLKAYLGRLRVALRAAGVPIRLVDPLIVAADAFWQGVYDIGDQDIGLGVSTNLANELDWRQGLVLTWLDRRWRLIHRWKAFREAARPTLPVKGE